MRIVIGIQLKLWCCRNGDEGTGAEMGGEGNVDGMGMLVRAVEVEEEYKLDDEVRNWVQEEPWWCKEVVADDVIGYAKLKCGQFGVVVKEGKVLRRGFPLYCGGKRMSHARFNGMYGEDEVATHCMLAEAFVREDKNWLDRPGRLQCAMGVNCR